MTLFRLRFCCDGEQEPHPWRAARELPDCTAFLRVSQVGSRDAAGGRAPRTRKNPKIEGQHARGGLREAEPIRRLAAAALKWTAAPDGVGADSHPEGGLGQAIPEILCEKER
jgi:hypothetical protein